MPETINKSPIRKDAIELMNGGMTKQEAFEALVEKYNVSITVAEAIETVPHPEAKKKYKTEWIILIVIIIVTALPDIASFNAISLGIDVLFLLVVANYWVRHFVWITILRGFLALVCPVTFIFITDFHPLISQIAGVFIFIAVAYIYLSVYLSKKLCPKPEIKREIYLNREGKKRGRNVYIFKNL